MSHRWSQCHENSARPVRRLTLELHSGTAFDMLETRREARSNGVLRFASELPFDGTVDRRDVDAIECAPWDGAPAVWTPQCGKGVALENDNSFTRQTGYRRPAPRWDPFIEWPWSQVSRPSAIFRR